MSGHHVCVTLANDTGCSVCGAQDCPVCGVPECACICKAESEDARVDAFVEELAAREGYGEHPPTANPKNPVVRAENKAYQEFAAAVKELLKKHNLVF